MDTAKQIITLKLVFSLFFQYIFESMLPSAEKFVVNKIFSFFSEKVPVIFASVTLNASNICCFL